MSDKWTNLSDNMLEDYHLHNDSSSQMQNIVVNSSIPPIENQKNRSEHMMMSSEHFIVPSDSSKKLCISTSECNLPETTCREILDAEQVTGGECQNFKKSCGMQKSCFVCSCQTDENDFVSVKESSKYSHAPLVVLLMDVLGYRLEMESLHSKIICRSCYQLIDTIDELQQTLTESKTDLRRKFLETFQKLKLKYPRTEKMLKSQCLKSVHQVKKRKGGRVAKAKNNCNKNAKQKVQLNEESLNEEEILQKDSEAEVHIDQELNCSETSENLQCVQENEPNIVYDTDPMFFSPDEKLKAGYTKSTNGSEEVLYCFFCSTQYNSSVSLKMHVRAFHMPIIIYGNGQGTTGSKYRIGMKVQNISHNERFAIEKSYCCLFCLSSYKLESSLQFHFRGNHSPHKPYQCFECNEQFRKSIELSRHRIYTCPSLVKKNSKF